MPLISCRKAVRVLIVAVSCATGLAWADDVPTPPQPDSGALKLDQTIQGLKDDVLQFNRDATALEQDSLFPPYSRTSVFLGVRISGLLVKEFSVSFDGGEPQKFTFDDNQSRAFLLHKGLRRVLRVNLPPGAHRIRADFSAQYADAKPDAAPITGNLEAIFDKNYNDTDLGLMLVRSGFMAPPSITLQQTRSAR
jgi:hypothetical protein